MKKLMFLIFLFVYSFGNCDNRKFNLIINDSISLKSVLFQLSRECNLNIIVTDKKANEIIKSNLEFININNQPFLKMLEILLNSKNLFFSLKRDILKISFYKTKTFKVNYIPNTISGFSDLNSTNNNIYTKYHFDFWENLKNNLIKILKNVSSTYKEPIINKNAGLVTITANKIQLEEVEKYINSLNKSLNKEVLIDVHIYSVELSKSHQTGIDWSKLNVGMNANNVPLRATYLGGSRSVFNSATFSIRGFLDFLAQNGNVNSISNPKIVVLNSQKAIISVGNTIYYKYIYKMFEDKNGNNVVEYKIDKLFVGVLLDITPQIGDNGEIILNINPKISSFKDLTQLNSNRDMPPDTKSDTLMSVVKLKDNQTLVLGGLITDDESLKINGVPILKEIPLIKYLFSYKEKISFKKELVFVITPHIIDFSKTKKLSDLGYKKVLNGE